jgi:hypothetical protein
LKSIWRILRHDRSGAEMALRILGYMITQASPEERRSLLQLLSYAQRSSHPQRWGIAISSFLTLVNTRAMLLAQAPGIAETPYPEGPPAPRAAKPEVRLPLVRAERAPPTEARS